VAGRLGARSIRKLVAGMENMIGMRIRSRIDRLDESAKKSPQSGHFY